MGLWDRRHEHRLRLIVLSAFIVLGYFGGLVPTGTPIPAQLRSEDQLFRWRHRWQPPPAAAQALVLITIDDAALQTMRQKWPWSRAVFAELLEAVGRQTPRLIVLDFAFAGSSTPEADQALAEAIHRHAPVLLAAYIDPAGRYVQSEPMFLAAGGVSGLINKPRDRDLVVRRVWPALQLPGNTQAIEYALEVKAAAYALGGDSEHLALAKRRLTIGSPEGRPLRTIRMTGPMMRINPLLDAGQIPSISCAEVLAGHAPPNTFTGKIVLVGTTSEIIHDVYPTPLGLVPGVTVSANAITTILSHRPLHAPPWWSIVVLCLGLAVLTGLAAFELSVPLGILTTIALTSLVVGGSVWAAWLDEPVEWFSPVILTWTAWLVGLLYKYFVLLFAGAQLQHGAITDPESGALTARQGRMRLRAAFQRARITRRPAALVLIEPARTTPAQTVTPERLRALVAALQPHLPRGGLIARLAAARLGLLLPQATAAQTLARAPQYQALVNGVTLAIGVADTIPPEIRSSRDWLACADVALQKAHRVPARIAHYESGKDAAVLGLPEETGQPPAADHFAEVLADLEERNRELERALQDTGQAQQETQEALIETAKVLVRALETKDPYTAGHSERVSAYAARLAQRVNLPPDQVEEIREAGLLHDIGKIGLPEGVLHKIGALTDEERNAIRHHHAEGSRILEPLKHFQKIIPLIYYHHERYDGKGFPHGLTGDLIPIGAQVIAVVDSFDAMTTARGYNVPMTGEQGLEELRRCAGTQFNPQFVEAFAALIREEGTAGADHRH